MNDLNDLKNPNFRKLLSNRILEDIDEWAKEKYDDGFRSHLGASLIGQDCKFYLWATFRWLFKPEFSGRVQRLFQRGHLEEFRFIDYLEGIGCKVFADDLDNNQVFRKKDGSYFCTNKNEDFSSNLLNIDVSNDQDELKKAKALGLKIPQYRVSGVNGHFGGSIDGVIILPKRFAISEPVLAEYKTIGDNKKWSELKKKGLKLANPVHYAQTSVYGKKLGFRFVLYMCVCKNDDEIYIELCELDHNLGESSELKAAEIINSQTPPSKISLQPDFFKCKFCPAKTICHEKGETLKNCRSCLHASPGENAIWNCEKFGIIPKEFIKEGCSEHKGLLSV